jgi:hypothetical protein
MASRLSEESLRAAYDAGHQSFSLTTSDAADLISGRPVDLEAILDSEKAKEQIQALRPQPLYQALMIRGLEDSLDVLSYISRSQLIKFFDYDVWVYDHLSPAKAFRWLSMFKELGREELAKRFRQLDEEYQLALLGRYIALFDLEAYEDLPEAHQDRVSNLPCNELYYEITTEDPQIIEMIEELIAANLQEDIQYTYSLLAHAAYMPPNEEEGKINQFRKARLEEDGFVTYEESLSIFRPVNMEQIKRESSLPGYSNALAIRPEQKDQSFLAAVLSRAVVEWESEQYDDLTRGFAFLSNSLCAASRVEPDDSSGLKIVLKQVNSLAGLGLEYLSGHDVDLGLSLLKKTHPQILFRVGMTLVGKLQEEMVSLLESCDLPKSEYMFKMLRLDKRGEILRTLDLQYVNSLGFVRTEIVKGLFNRYPVCPRGVSEDKGGSSRILFSPIDSISTLMTFANTLDGIAALIHFNHMTGGKGDMDKNLFTAFARVLIGETFDATPLNSDQLEVLIGMDNDAVQTISADFFGELEANLRTSLMDTTGQRWSISRNSGIDQADPVQNAMNAFTDLVMNFHMQREIAGREGSQALKSILLTD